ncbi:MAG TPA: hypothetical protein VH144_02485 [Candidatus Saccharimonadales bacterium]|jgi:hypothetical protein|nr:hypothetical protein [Candidatus Saccharimonadales bacterium]
MIEIIGIVGAMLLVLAYLMVSLRRWSGQSWPYQLTNFAAAVLLIIYSLAKTAYANVFINLVWVAVAIVGMTMLVWRRKKTIRKGRF